MSARHRLPQPERSAPPPPRRGLTASRANLLIGSIAASVAVAGVGSAAIVELTASEPAAPQSDSTAAAPQQPLSQQGTLIAVGPDSVTARSADGYTQTYLLTPDTTAVTDSGGHVGGAATSFSVNDDVAIVGTVSGDTATATTVAAREVVGLSGPPMDFVPAQPASNSVSIP